jgi:hypothetical protein
MQRPIAVSVHPIRRQLQHCYTLAFAELRHQNRPPIGKLKRIVVDVLPLQIGLAKAGDCPANATKSEVRQQALERMAEFHVPLEREFGTGAQTYRDGRLSNRSETARERSSKGCRY